MKNRRPVGTAVFLVLLHIFNYGADQILFNNYAWGGYILWQYPERKVFIDGRGPQLKINDQTTILQEYYKFFSEDQRELQKMLDKYKISLVLTNRKNERQKLNFLDKTFIYFFANHKNNGYKQSDLIRNLDALGWKKVYEDKNTVLFSK